MQQLLMPLFQKNELKLLWAVYIDALISPILFFAPIFFVVYFIDLGLSLTQIGILMALIPLTALLFEIPTGAIADIYGRKFSTILGFIIEGMCFLLLWFITDYYAMLFIFALWGIGTTFTSGAAEAWFVDLIKHKHKHLMQDIFVKTQSFDSIALIISGVLGALMVKQFGLSVIWIMGALSYLASICFLLFVKERFTKKEVKIKESYKTLIDQTRKSLIYSRKHKVILPYLIAGFIFAISTYLNQGITWIPFMQSLHFPDYAFGFMWSGMHVVGAIAPWIAKKFAKEGKERKFIVNSVILYVIATLAIVFAFTIPVAFIILFFIVLFPLMMIPAGKVYFHRFIPNKLRATIGSIEAMAYSIPAIFSPIIAGILIDVIGAKYTIFLAGIIAIPSAFIYWRMKEPNSIS